MIFTANYDSTKTRITKLGADFPCLKVINGYHF